MVLMVERAARPRLPESIGEEGAVGECDIVASGTGLWVVKWRRWEWISYGVPVNNILWRCRDVSPDPFINPIGAFGDAFNPEAVCVTKQHP
jgi:hypothetical protein